MHVCALQVFLIIHYQPLVNTLADVIFNGDLSVFTPQTDVHSAHKNMVTLTKNNIIIMNMNCKHERRKEVVMKLWGHGFLHDTPTSRYHNIPSPIFLHLFFVDVFHIFAIIFSLSFCLSSPSLPLIHLTS